MLIDFFEELPGYSESALAVEAAALRLGITTFPGRVNPPQPLPPPQAKAFPFTDEDLEPKLLDTLWHPFKTFLTLASEGQLALTATGNLNGQSIELLVKDIGLAQFNEKRTRYTEDTVYAIAELRQQLRDA